MKPLLVFLVAVLSLQAAGTVTQTAVLRLGSSDQYTITLSVVADASDGSVPTTVISRSGPDIATTDGMSIVGIETDPGSTAPTDNWDLTLTDIHNTDIMQSACINRDTAVSEICSANPVPLIGNTTLVISNNSVPSATITVVVYLVKTTVAKRNSGGNVTFSGLVTGNLIQATSGSEIGDSGIAANDLTGLTGNVQAQLNARPTSPITLDCSAGEVTLAVCGPGSAVQDNYIMVWDGVTGLKAKQNVGNARITSGGIIVGDGTAAGALQMNELSANGSNYRQWLVPDALTADLKYRLPNSVPAAASVLVWGAASGGITDGSHYTLSGNGTVLCTVSGSLTSGHLIVADANGNCVDGGAPTSGTFSYGWVGQAFNGVSAGTNYVSVVGGTTSATQSLTYFHLGAACTVDNLAIKILVNPQPASGSLVSTVQKNGSDTSITCTINASDPAGTQCTDSAHPTSFAANDDINIKVVNNSVSTSPRFQGRITCAP